MIKKGQSDLTSQGTFFSLVIIFSVNLAFGLFFFVLVAEPITWGFFWDTFSLRLGQCYAALYHAAQWLWNFVVQRIDNTGK
jgi:hypothetical protein